MSEMNKKPDLSWMWQCSSNPENMLDFSDLTNNKGMLTILNNASAMGFRLAMQRMVDLGLIEMKDIDREFKEDDQIIWDDNFKTGF